MKRLVGLSLAAILACAQAKTENLSFVTCPIVRDTKTAPVLAGRIQRRDLLSGQSGRRRARLLSSATQPPRLSRGRDCRRPARLRRSPAASRSRLPYCWRSTGLAIRFCRPRTASKRRRVRRIAAPVPGSGPMAPATARCTSISTTTSSACTPPTQSKAWCSTSSNPRPRQSKSRPTGVPPSFPMGQ